MARHLSMRSPQGDIFEDSNDKLQGADGGQTPATRAQPFNVHLHLPGGSLVVPVDKRMPQRLWSGVTVLCAEERDVSSEDYGVLLGAQGVALAFATP